MQQTIGIVGLGLIGGSVAKALKVNAQHVVFGTDLNSQTMQSAFEESTISQELTASNLSTCNILLLALYPQASIQYIKYHQNLISKNTTVIDLCGIKRVIETEIQPIAKEKGFIFIGGHPMAGTEKVGYQNASATLFQNASMILTPDETVSQKVLQNVEKLFLEIGFGRITLSTPMEHDKIIAYTSQLAHVLSSAYVKSPTALEFNGFSAGSFQDMTRVAWLSEEMWTELFLENNDYLAEEVEELIERLQLYAVAIRTKNQQVLQNLLKEGRLRKELLKREK